MTQVQLADGFGEASQANGMGKDLSLNGTCHPVAGFELHPTMLPRLGLNPAQLTYRFVGAITGGRR